MKRNDGAGGRRKTAATKNFDADGRERVRLHPRIMEIGVASQRFSAQSPAVARCPAKLDAQVGIGARATA